MTNDMKPKTFHKCSRCGNVTEKVQSESSVQVKKLLDENAQLKEENETLRNLLENLEDKRVEKVELDESLIVDSSRLERVRKKGPFYLFTKTNKVHLQSCSFCYAGYPGWQEVRSIELGLHRLADCCCSNKALSLLEQGKMSALREFQRNVGKAKESEDLREVEKNDHY